MSKIVHQIRSIAEGNELHLGVSPGHPLVQQESDRGAHTHTGGVAGQSSRGSEVCYES